MSRSRGRRAPADAALPILAVLRLGQAQVGAGAEFYPAVTLDGRGLGDRADPHELARRLRQGFRATVAPAHLADGVRFAITIAEPLGLRFSFDVRYDEPFGDSFLGGAMLTGRIVISFAGLSAVAAQTADGTPFIETEGLIFQLAPGSLLPPRRAR
jgi:hypothetical protein